MPGSACLTKGIASLYWLIQEFYPIYKGKIMADSKITLNVDNMSCGHCSGMVQKTLEAIDGISEVSVDLEGKKARFSAADPALAQTALDAVTKAGYPATLT